MLSGITATDRFRRVTQVGELVTIRSLTKSIDRSDSRAAPRRKRRVKAASHFLADRWRRAARRLWPHRWPTDFLAIRRRCVAPDVRRRPRDPSADRSSAVNRRSAAD